jgi:hypothetical protein
MFRTTLHGRRGFIEEGGAVEGGSEGAQVGVRDVVVLGKFSGY